MHCVIYKGRKKPDTYLFVEMEDDFGRVPDSLLNMLGELELVMNLELTEGRKLAQVDAQTVRNQLQTTGFYLQLPPDHSNSQI